ncbi:hypothetical protein OIU34_33020 [Pararhizobium sp. BT-229]|uniref:hypothetical protein n=1 Tax=Pararhizobium sp. BT-229 TaxID=2986923 RepID=UPI0021F7E61C|nr:hypothetical protein [Pararhizobium sp. BT-229]MCV9966702.1 hypothetical protein [Pararhizobium sp. BT-229]
MKIVAIGGTGLLGSKVVSILQQNGENIDAADGDPGGGSSCACCPYRSRQCHTASRCPQILRMDEAIAELLDADRDGA